MNMKRIAVIMLALLFVCLPALGFTRLQEGSRGSDVKTVQERLSELGYPVGSADGSYGAKTRDAVIAFQMDNDLDVTGVVDQATWDALMSKSAKAYDADSAASDPDVVRAQRLMMALGTELEDASGVWDQKSETAYTRYCRENKLDSDDLSAVLDVMSIEVQALTDGLYLYEDEGLYGYKNSEGDVAIEAQFVRADGIWRDGLACVEWPDGTHGYIDPVGKTAFTTGNNMGGRFSDGVARMSRSGKWGYIDMNGRAILPMTEMDAYDLTQFACGYARVNDHLIDKSARKTSLSLQFQDVVSMMASAMNEPFSDGLMLLRKVTEEGRKCGFVDTSGKTAIAFQYDDAQSFSEGYAAVGEGRAYVNMRYGYINVRGEVEIALEYDAAYPFSEGFAVVHHPEQGWGTVSKKGAFTALEIEFDDVLDGRLQSGRIAILRDGRVGFVTRKGAEAVPCVYLPDAENIFDGYAYTYRNGLALAILEDGQLVYIDLDGNVAFEAGKMPALASD